MWQPKDHLCTYFGPASQPAGCASRDCDAENLLLQNLHPITVLTPCGMKPRGVYPVWNKTEEEFALCGKSERESENNFVYDQSACGGPSWQQLLLAV